MEEWRASGPDSSGRLEDNEEQAENSDDVDTDELNEELEDLNCAHDGYQGGTAGIGPEEIDLIIDLCNGKEIPTDKRLALLRAIHHIRIRRLSARYWKVSMAATAVSANFWTKPSG